ncbi:type II toxin-antitoxin system prevent-host-death family antitoxin [Chloroflexi bacterium TSY]|nr:type II toxin-antitoxin system prevent-host-death family antitoxin [Chloroflexi bacterium TSY]
MLKVSATNLRNHLFDYLDRAAKGETIIIQRNNQEVARLTPIEMVDWRNNMSITPQVLVTPKEFIRPIDDVWIDYL